MNIKVVFKPGPFSRLLPGPRLLYFTKSIPQTPRAQSRHSLITRPKVLSVQSIKSLASGNAFHNKYTTSTLENTGLPSVTVVIWELKNRVCFSTRELVLSILQLVSTCCSPLSQHCVKTKLCFHRTAQKSPGGKALSQRKLITDSRQHRGGAMPLVAGTTVRIKRPSQAEHQRSFRNV